MALQLLRGPPSGGGSTASGCGGSGSGSGAAPRPPPPRQPRRWRAGGAAPSRSTCGGAGAPQGSRGGAACSDRAGEPAPARGVRCSAAAGGAKALHPAVSLETVVSISGPDDLQRVLMANELVASTFYSSSDNALVDAVSFNSYRLRSAAQTLSLHMGGGAQGRGHATVVALQQPLLEAPAWQRQEQEQRAIGVVNVTLMEASPSVAAAAGVRQGTPLAMVTNMAVAPEHRRRGIAHQLMQAVLHVARHELEVAPPAAILLAYKLCEPAVRLYSSWGFQQTDWEDPLWLADAEKGRLGRQRRILMVRCLGGLGQGSSKGQGRSPAEDGAQPAGGSSAGGGGGGAAAA